jgi:hypothetical protein
MIQIRQTEDDLMAKPLPIILFFLGIQAASTPLACEGISSLLDLSGYASKGAQAIFIN